MRVPGLILGVMTGVLLAVAGCGGGSGGESSDAGAVREALVDALTAADAAHARPFIDTAEWLAAIEDPSASQYNAASDAEKRTQDERLFSVLASVRKISKLNDAPSIRAAVDRGTVDVLSQVRSANVRFTGPDSDGKGVVSFDVKMRRGLDDRWRVVNLEADF